MQKITPCLWFDSNAEEAVTFYTSIFKHSKVTEIARYSEAGAEASGQPKGTVMTIAFHLEGQSFLALNGGQYFTFSPGVSFFVSCKARDEVEYLWNEFAAGGTVMMKLDTYPFSERFGWIADKYGVSWQLNLGERKQKIAPFLMFVGEQHGKAEEAINLYVSLFRHSGVTSMTRHSGDEGETEGTVKHAIFSLDGQEFMAMDSGLAHAFTLTQAISFMVNCGTQEEVDHFWDKLSVGGETMPCGWLSDRYGLPWQIAPVVLNEMLQDKDPQRAERVMKAMLQMKRIDIGALKEAYENE